MNAWPTAQGRVTYSEVRMVPAGQKFRYFTDVEIAYAVDGIAYTTRSVRADSAMSSFDRAWADRIVNRYPRRTQVEVHYRRENPSDARVEIWPQPAIWVLLVWGGSALFAAIWIWKRVTRSAGPSETAT